MLLKLTLVSLLLIIFVSAFDNSDDVKRVKRLAKDQCGQPVTPGGLISHGEITDRDKWPFLSALFDSEKQKFFCGASLITRKHVLTAAHCLQEKMQTFPKKPSEVIAYLGKYDLNVVHERGAVPAYPTEFFIHPDWKPLELKKYDADIAIIKLEEEVPLKANIYPVCLWTTKMKPLREDDGTVVGW